MSAKIKTALVPGASRPLGRAIARMLANKGISLVLPYFDWPESVADMKDEFSKLSITCVFPETDLREEEDVLKLTHLIKKEFGTLDYLVNNIERGGMPVVHGSYDNDHNKGQWDLEIATTLKAKWLLYHHCSPILKQSPDGAVVNISSIAGRTGRSGPASLFFNDGYSAANMAIKSFTETWARESAPNVRVNELMVGLVDSRHGKGTRGWEALTEEEKESLTSHTLLKRTASVEEIARAIHFLLFDATYMTGSTIVMDGGYLLGGDQVPSYPKGIL